MRQKMIAMLLGAVCTAVVLHATTEQALAQLELPGSEEAFLEISPQTPRPLQEFTATVRDFSQEVGKADIQWFIDGERQTFFENNPSLTATAPRLGEKLTLRAIVNPNTPSVKIIETVLIVNEVDIVLEGITTVPYFYKGLSHPVFGSEFIATAIPHLFSESGRKLPNTELFFRWSIDDKLLLEGKGASVFKNKIPDFGAEFIRLDVESENSEVRFSKIIRFPAVQPLIRFYSYNQIRGLSRNAVIDTYVSSAEEAEFRADPYYMSTDIFQNGQLSWSVNGVRVENSDIDAQLLTVSSPGPSFADIGFVAQHFSTFSQLAEGLFQVVFLENS